MRATFQSCDCVKRKRSRSKTEENNNLRKNDGRTRSFSRLENLLSAKRRSDLRFLKRRGGGEARRKEGQNNDETRF